MTAAGPRMLAYGQAGRFICFFVLCLVAVPGFDCPLDRFADLLGDVLRDTSFPIRNEGSSSVEVAGYVGGLAITRKKAPELATYVSL